jgi:hypothetical protein
MCSVVIFGFFVVTIATIATLSNQAIKEARLDDVHHIQAFKFKLNPQG